MLKRPVIYLMIIALLALAASTYTEAGEVRKMGSDKELVVLKSLTLEDCYDLALKQSELIAINEDMIKTTEARFLQALSIVLPHLSFKATYFREESPPSSTPSDVASLKPHTSSEGKFNVTQTLFNGFKAIAAIKGSRLEKDQRIKEKERAQQLLLVDVSNAFYLLLETRRDIKTLKMIKKALADRIRELKARENLGRSKPSEVVNAKAQYYIVQSQIEVAENQEVLVRQILEFLVGRPVGELLDTFDRYISLQDLNHYLEKSDSRPDVEAAKFAWEVAKKELQMVNSEFLPTVDLTANYYTQRTAFDKGTDWDVSIDVDVPIFNGTETLGKSREWELKADEKRLLFQRSRRSAPKDIKDAYSRLKTAIAIQESVRKAYATSRLNYHLQKKDYERSLVNNLDVLTAIQTLQDSERNYIHALYETKRLYWQFRVSIGETIEEGPYDII
jgi:outer membrane protein